MSIGAALVALGLVVGSAVDQPLAGEKFTADAPTGFVVGWSTPANSMTEWVPEGESVENWSQIVTTQEFRNVKLSPGAFLQYVGGRFTRACPGTTSKDDKGILIGKVNGYDVAMLVLVCPLNPTSGRPETTIFRVIKGSETLYSYQRAWREVSDSEFDAGWSEMQAVTLCAPRSTDHPCRND